MNTNKIQIPGVVWFVLIQGLTLILMDWLPKNYPDQSWVALAIPLMALGIKIAAMLLKPDEPVEIKTFGVDGEVVSSETYLKSRLQRILLG